MRDASSGDNNNPEVHYSTIRISGWLGVFLGETPRDWSYSKKENEKHKVNCSVKIVPASRREACEFQKGNEEECSVCSRCQ